MKKLFVIYLALMMALTMLACGGDGSAVFVQPVSRLADLGGIAPGERFAGVVVSEFTTEIRKDDSMTVAELLVKEGDDVTEGQVLFSYDTQQAQLNLDKQKLELEQLLATIENYKSQIADLEKDMKKDSGNKLQYTVEIQSLQVDLKEAELNVTAKENAVAQSEAVLQNAVVVSPVTGRVQSISENGSDMYGNPVAYITIQQSGAYRIKGTIGELQMGSITFGTRMQVFSRTDPNVTWSGVVALVDYESPSQGNQYDMMYYGVASDELYNTSNYPFYLELDSTDGLILGQHVYMQLEGADEASQGLAISSAFFAWDEDGSVYVWAENRGKLEKRTVELGEYHMMNDTYEILSGLTEEDYIAFPDPELCVEGAATTRSEPVPEDAVMESGVG